MADELRGDRYAKWSYRAALALAEWLDETCDEHEEFDATAIRVDWDEYATAIEAAIAYGWDAPGGSDDAEAEALAWLEERTDVVPFTGGVVARTF
jgi:hypothetical protein